MAEEFHETQVEIKNAEGLHMRPAMLFVDMANSYDCSIEVGHSDTWVDGKSIMQVTMLAAIKGTVLTIRATGKEARDALDALRELVEDRHFDEDIVADTN